MGQGGGAESEEKVSTGYSNRKWICPFFAWDERGKVHCECGNCISFPDREAYVAYTDQYCASLPGWQKCSVASALLAYYERMDAEKP